MHTTLMSVDYSMAGERIKERGHYVPVARPTSKEVRFFFGLFTWKGPNIACPDSRGLIY